MKRLFLSAIVAASVFAVNAQDSTTVAAEPAAEEASELSISGSIDSYYKLTPNNQSPGSSFANGPTGFNLGMANVVLAKEGKKSGFVADLVIGPRGDDAVFADWDASGSFGLNSAILNQLYAYWNVSDGVTLTFGNFNTFLGYEVISPTGNFNYSTSFMFSNGPFSHTGLKADFTLSDDFTLMTAIMNPTDATSSSFGVDAPTFGLQLGMYDAAWLNVVVGDQDGAGGNGNTMQVDLTAGTDVSDELYLGVNTTYNTTAGPDGSDASSGFYGAALYTQYAFSDALSAGIRGEYFAWHATGTDAVSVIDLTASLNYTVGDLTFIPEFRIDLAEDAYTTSNAKDISSSLPQFYLAAVYAF